MSKHPAFDCNEASVRKRIKEIMMLMGEKEDIASLMAEGYKIPILELNDEREDLREKLASLFR
jgi:hypothetical protein